MRRISILCLVMCLVVANRLYSQAGGNEAEAIIDRAIKAHLGSGKDTLKKGMRGKNKGTLYVQGLELEFTQEVAVQIPEKFKDVMDINVNGKTVQRTIVFNGKEGWIKADGKVSNAKQDLLEELKDVSSLMSISSGVFVKDKTLKLDVIGEARVNDKPAIGVKITRQGKNPIDIYFDRATGLQAKVERIKRDSMADKDVTEERIILKYKDVGGRKVPEKVEVKVDGKKLLEAEVLEIHFFETLDDSEFARPQ